MKENQDKIWEFYQNQASHSFEGSDARMQFLVSKIEKGAKCLNIGVGAGNFERFALQKGIDVHSLDPSKNSIHKLEKILGKKAQVGYSQDIPHTDKSFDVVVMSEVLEHLNDEVLAQTIPEVKRVLKDAGRFIGTVPSNEKLEDNIVVSPSDGHVFHRWGHLQSFSAERMKKVLSGAFSSVSVTEKKFVNWKTLNWKGKLIMGTHVLAKKAGLSGSKRNLFFEAKV